MADVQSTRHGDEPTQMLPTISPRRVPPGSDAARPETPGWLRREPLGPPAAPSVEGRAVIVYEPEPRRRWGLLVFTAVMVALTTGVVLGQAVAWQPVSSSAAAQAGAIPTYSTPPVVTPTPADLAPPVSAQRVSAPLGSFKTRTLEVTGTAPVLQIRSVDLDGLLFDVVTTDGGTTPTVEDTARGPRLSLARTGAEATTGPVGILLNAKVKWTIRISGGFVDQQIDMQGGKLAGIELVGEAARVALDLSAPTGTVPIKVEGSAQDFRIRAAADVPVRLRLAKGADTSNVDGKQRQDVPNNDVTTTKGWSAAKNRYDVKASARMTSAVIEHAR